MPILSRFATIIAMVALSGALTAEALADRRAADTVSSFYATLLGTMRDGDALGPRGRYAKLEPAVRASFDIPFMTQTAAGPPWTTIPEAKRRELTEAFGRFVAAIWADRFKSYAGQKLEITAERLSGTVPLVETRIVKPNGEPVPVNYLMRRDGEAWRVADVYFNGTISEMAMRRAEFSRVLKDDGVDDLIRSLNGKVEAMLSAAAGGRSAAR